MEKIIVKKSKPLTGAVDISGAKNAALPVLAATLLCEEECVIKNVPKLTDVDVMHKLLVSLGASVKQDENTFTVCAKKIKKSVAPYELVSKMRASFLVMGPLLSRTGNVSISLPGGCPIGVRPVDLHLKGFSILGAEIKNSHGFISASAKKLTGDRIYLDFPSVGATENIIMAAVLAEGVTTIENCAGEPEIIDLINFLNKMGASITYSGSKCIKIKGVKELHGCEYSIIPDRIEAGTFMLAAAITKGDITVNNIISEHLKPVTAKLREMGAQINEKRSSIRVTVDSKLKNTDVKTLPFPGFPTDMQAQMVALMSLCGGTSVVVETVFENRFLYVSELNRMGANIKIDGRSAIIEGVGHMTGAKVNATDLRAGAALILAGLSARGDTEIGEIGYIDRGYCDLVEKLCSLGADISRCETEDKGLF